MLQKELRMLDVRPSVGVEITINTDGKLWVNVDGLCVCRVQWTPSHAAEINIDGTQIYNRDPQREPGEELS